MGGLYTVSVLLIEDNSNETRLITEIICDSEWNVHFSRVKDGMEAMNYLHKKGKYKDCSSPSLILLDLNLPKKNGFEVLEEIKTDKELKCIPVIVLTVSNNEKDIIKSYELHANAYIMKPIDLNKFEQYMYIFKDFWFHSVKLPKKT